MKFPRQRSTSSHQEDSFHRRELKIPTHMATLPGTLTLPDEAPGVVLFAHGSGSSRHSPRNRAVARALNEAGLATLLFDLLTPDEEEADRYTGHLRFDIGLLADRLGLATAWLREDAALRELPVGYFGSSTGGGAALVAAAAEPTQVRAVVSRGGRPDLAGSALHAVRAPTLLIVGGEDDVVIDLNRAAMEEMNCEVELEIIPGATHLFEEPGALEQVAQFAGDWFVQHFTEAAAESEGLISPSLRKLRR